MTARLAAAVLVGLVALAGCGGDTPEKKPSPPNASPTPAPPAAGTCYRMTFAQAAEPTTDAKPVACRHPHTAQTIYVGRIDPISDGHLLAVDSERVVEQVAKTCPAKLREHVGGDQETRRLGRFETVWFAPTLPEAENGETWFRCDLIVLAGEEKLLLLPRDARGVLDREDVLDEYGTCGTVRPDKPEFVRVACKRPHRWRAVATVDLNPAARLGGPAATREADDACRDVASARSEDPLKFEWTFEWPNAELWESGQKWGWCWVPE